MIKCLSKKRTFKTLYAKWNATKVDEEAAQKEYSILEEQMKSYKSAYQRVSEEYEKSKSEFGNLSVEKILAEKDGRELDSRFELDYSSAKSDMMRNACWYSRGKQENEELEKVFERYNEEKEKCKLEEEKARRELGLYLASFIKDLHWEREVVNAELKLFIEQCEAKFGHWYDIEEAKDYSDAGYCKCVFCKNSDSNIPWYNKNYIGKTYLSERWGSEHQEALNKINAMKETLKEIQELLEIICFAKEEHEYGEKVSGFMSSSYYECKVCGYKKYVYDEDEW